MGLQILHSGPLSHPSQFPNIANLDELVGEHFPKLSISSATTSNLKTQQYNKDFLSLLDRLAIYKGSATPVMSVTLLLWTISEEAGWRTLSVAVF
ncbi:unnamed protein product [Sphenostylis stenocarpa]|uniref:Uncharacterized protein n=1 Tax=Sphenostylis stenocarpa TaxID=92480 RepID=A0AA86S526_9FABA|nr:unnamed protein product [Sphenostylis stenocarpa]